MAGRRVREKAGEIEGLRGERATRDGDGTHIRSSWSIRRPWSLRCRSMCSFCGCGQIKEKRKEKAKR